MMCHATLKFELLVFLGSVSENGKRVMIHCRMLKLELKILQK
ncbi:hypothetical protein SOVF_149720, partial [Spinacia oleracea]